MTDWETTKIKGDVKARAKEDPRTYTEIMDAGLGSNDSSNEERPIDMGELASSIVDRIEETQGVTIENVEVDAGSTLTREEVEGVVENWVERNYDRLRRGEI